MRITVLGGAGRTGRQILLQAVQAGHDVTALVRDPARLADLDGVRRLQGDARDPAALEGALEGAEALLSALGPSSTQGGGLLEWVVPNAVRAMQRHGTRRYLAVSGAGADAPGDRKALPDRIASAVMHVVTRPIVVDKEAEIATLARSDREWVLVRPPRLTEGPLTEHYAVGLDLPLGARATISRADVAHFLLHQLEATPWLGKAPFIRAL